MHTFHVKKFTYIVAFANLSEAQTSNEGASCKFNCILTVDANRTFVVTRNIITNTLLDIDLYSAKQNHTAKRIQSLCRTIMSTVRIYILLYIFYYLVQLMPNNQMASEFMLV